jgi:pimeloyl-ACP methyl ester carboxylesterase
MHAVRSQAARLGACLSLLLVACSSAEAPSDSPISFAPCGALVADEIDRAVAVACGTLDVPEVHAVPDGAKLRLRVFISRGGDGDRDPLVYLQGGPGGSVGGLAHAGWSAYLAGAFQRDVIILEQRGNALSTPALDCKVGETETDEAEALRSCAADYAAHGTRLEAFNTIESAHDVDDLRRALGRSKLAVWGASYGALLAGTVLREHPEAISSLVLEASVTNERLYREFEREQTFPSKLEAFTQWLASTCAANARCSAAMPGLDPAAEMRTAIERAKVAPVTLGSAAVIDSEATFRRIFFVAMYTTPIAVLLVRMLYADSRGLLDAFDASVKFGTKTPRELLSAALTIDGVSATTNLVVNCYDVARNWDDRSVTTELDVLGFEGTQREGAQASATEFRRSCDVLRPPTAPQQRFRAPFSSDVPTLLLGATLDATTPIEWARETQRLVPRSQLVEVPCMGHGVTFGGGGCTVGILGSFLDDPGKPVDTSCLAARCSGTEIEHDLFYEDRFAAER